MRKSLSLVNWAKCALVTILWDIFWAGVGSRGKLFSKFDFFSEQILTQAEPPFLNYYSAMVVIGASCIFYPVFMVLSLYAYAYAKPNPAHSPSEQRGVKALLLSGVMILAAFNAMLWLVLSNPA